MSGTKLYYALSFIFDSEVLFVLSNLQFFMSSDLNLCLVPSGLVVSNRVDLA
jgi:hypothetical protein